jgi:hypothetical protein
MDSENLTGRWWCHRVDQEQSPEERARDDRQDDYRSLVATKTEFSTAVLDLEKDGSYRLHGEVEDYWHSHGTWSAAGDTGELELAEEGPQSSGIQGGIASGESLTVTLRLVPDAHDGLDLLRLTFKRQPIPPAPTTEGLLEQLLADESEDEFFAHLDAARGDEAALASLWDAALVGEFAHPAHPNAGLHCEALAAGGFRSAHLEQALKSLDCASNWQLVSLIIEKAIALPQFEETVASWPAPWLAKLTMIIMGSMKGHHSYAHLLPHDCVRDYVTRESYCCFVPIDAAFARGDSDLAQTLFRYRGYDLLEKPLALIEKRKIHEEALAAALEYLADPANSKGDTGPWKSAIALAIVLVADTGESLPPTLVAALEVEPKGGCMGRLNEGEKERLKAAIATFPASKRRLFEKRTQHY